MGPKAFITCYVCFREFGSRSIPFHEPKCLERWRSSNRSLPPEKRSTTPVKPVGWKNSTESTWLCTNCQISVPAAKRGEHAANCFGKPKSGSLLLQSKITSNNMAAGTKISSPKKGKENKNSINHKCEVAAVEVVKNDHHLQKASPRTKKKDMKEISTVTSVESTDKVSPDLSSPQKETSTSNRSVRPQTKILRRPTPNLKHPVIQVDSDESGDNSERSKDDNSKKTKPANNDSATEQKPKNFIMYNKYNVEKNTKNNPKDKGNGTNQKDGTSSVPPGSNSIPNPCNSCNRSVAPERLHSHAKKDTKTFMLKKAASTETKTPSPQKRVISEDKSIKDLAKTEIIIPSPCKENKTEKTIEQTEKEMKEVTKSPKATVTNSSAKKSSNISSKACYICGREPGPFVLPAHEAKCLERWKKENSLLSPSRRKPSPKKNNSDTEKTQPESEKNQLQLEKVQPEIEKADPEPEKSNSESENGHPEPEKKVEKVERKKKHELKPDNSDPAWQAVQSQLVPCPSCGRTFFPERLPVHQRVCKGKLALGQSLFRTSSLREQSLIQGDDELGEKTSIYVPCYICGRSFGSWVIQMHESQCLRKWRRENEKLEEHLQQQEPHKPALVLNGSHEDLEEKADVAWESHLQQLVPCHRCGRTFFPDRLEIHERSCKGSFTGKQHSSPSQSIKLNKVFIIN